MIRSFQVLLTETAGYQCRDTDTGAYRHGDKENLVGKHYRQGGNGFVAQPGNPEGINDVIKAGGYRGSYTGET